MNDRQGNSAITSRNLTQVFVPDVAYHFCLNLPAEFTQPGRSLLAERCSLRQVQSPPPLFSPLSEGIKTRQWHCKQSVMVGSGFNAWQTVQTFNKERVRPVCLESLTEEKAFKHYQQLGVRLVQASSI